MKFYITTLSPHQKHDEHSQFEIAREITYYCCKCGETLCTISFVFIICSPAYLEETEKEDLWAKWELEENSIFWNARFVNHRSTFVQIVLKISISLIPQASKLEL